jgi:hypothetical protein
MLEERGFWIRKSLALDSWNYREYRLLAFQSWGKSCCRLKLYMGAVLNVFLRCLLRMLTPFFDFQELVSTRAPSSFNFSLAKGGAFYFCPALNKSLEACALFCVLFLYAAPLIRFFFVKLSETSPPQVEYFSEVLYMNTPYSAEYTLHCVHLLCVS